MGCTTQVRPVCCTSALNTVRERCNPWFVVADILRYWHARCTLERSVFLCACVCIRERPPPPHFINFVLSCGEQQVPYSINNAKSSMSLHTCFFQHGSLTGIQLVERSRARIYSTSLAGIAGSNPPGGMDVCVVSKDKKAKCRTIKTKTQIRMN
jgi:hypothetical protein